MNGNGCLPIGDGELQALTTQLDALHRETFPLVRRALSEFGANLAHLRAGAGRDPARRQFLLGAGGLALVGGVSACTGSGSAGTTPAADQRSTTSSAPVTSAPSSTASSVATSSTSAIATPSAPTSTGTGSVYTGDLRVVALAAALENLAVAAYGGATQVAATGRLGTVPKSFSTFVTTALTQHTEHAAAWNGVLGQAGKPKITGTPLTIARTQISSLQQATSVADIADLALSVEEIAAQTYTSVGSSVHDAVAVMTAATIAPVEAMHAAILHLVLGRYPVPESTIGTARAVQTNALTA